MATYNKFNVFTQDLIDGAHNFASNTFKVMLTNTAPVATNAVYADVSAGDLATLNGYTNGGGTTTISLSNTTGTEKVVATNVVTTATGAVGPFRYVIVYNATQTTPLKPLICWFDYGSSISLANGETFTFAPDATNGLFTLA